MKSEIIGALFVTMLLSFTKEYNFEVMRSWRHHKHNSAYRTIV